MALRGRLLPHLIEWTRVWFYATSPILFAVIAIKLMEQ